jgi:hypothetical protein
MKKFVCLALTLALPVLAYSFFGAIEPERPSPLQPTKVWHDVNSLYLTLNRTWIDDAEWPFVTGTDLLYRGYFGIGTLEGFLAYEAWDLETDFYGDDDWPTDVPWGYAPPRYGEQNYLAYFTDEHGDNPLGLRARQNSFGFHDWPNNDFIFILWTVYNAGAETIDDAAAGLYMDIDIGENDESFDDLAAYDPVDQFAYMCNGPGGADEPYFGAVTLGDGPTGSFHGWSIDESYESDSQLRFYGMLSQVGRFQELPREPYDWRIFPGYRLHDLAPGETRDYGVALVAGEDLQDMIANVLAARTKWNELFGGEPEPSLPPRMALSDPWPCPARDSAAIDVELAEPGNVEVALYDLSGRRVDTIYSGYMAEGRNELSVRTGGLPSGVYLIQAAGEGGAAVRRLVVAR